MCFFSNPDPLVEGSAAFKQSFDNFVKGVTLPIGGQGVLKGGTVATSNGKSVLQNSYGGKYIKLGTSLATLSTTILDLNKSAQKLEDVISALSDLKSVSNSYNDIKKKQ
ncbi:MAG: hypothetical protein IPN86_20450 [Saprospiraceae bacterium]|nr:hypothetical protein [Saprospiraceae bacterium]